MNSQDLASPLHRLSTAVHSTTLPRRMLLRGAVICRIGASFISTGQCGCVVSLRPTTPASARKTGVPNVRAMFRGKYDAGTVIEFPGRRFERSCSRTLGRGGARCFKSVLALPVHGRYPRRSPGVFRRQRGALDVPDVDRSPRHGDTVGVPRSLKGTRAGASGLLIQLYGSIVTHPGHELTESGRRCPGFP